MGILEGKTIANVNFVGSIAQRKMHFSSSIEVVVNEKNELFDALSVYIPKSFAPANIIDWEDFADGLTATKPAVFTCDVSNYKDIMTGDLLAQYTNLFRQDTNIAVIVYLIVFDDAASFVVSATSIAQASLTAAFEKLYFISFLKMLFDPVSNGAQIVIPLLGTKAKRIITITNATLAAVTLPAGTYLYNDGSKDFTLQVLAPIVLQVNDVIGPLTLYATTVGLDADIGTLTMLAADFSPVLAGTAANLTFVSTSAVDGTAANPSPAAVASKYFDFSLCLAQLCKADFEMSMFWSLVRLTLADDGFPVTTIVDPNQCWIRSKPIADQKAFMLALNQAGTIDVPIPRNQYYWGALWLMGALNTMVVSHSEPVNILIEVLAAWFAAKNGSGQYVGNKLSLLRLSGTTIKPFGYPSWLNSEVNVNDADGFDMLDAMKIGYLSTIADNTPQDSALSMARTVTGLPVNAIMIAKFVDYKSRQDCAKFITDTGTLVDPVLTDEEAYKKIQDTVMNNLLMFEPTRRLRNIQMSFPPFATAKTGLTKLEAASAWHANYVDDLDEITVSGGITEQ